MMRAPPAINAVPGIKRRCRTMTPMIVAWRIRYLTRVPWVEPFADQKWFHAY